MSVVLAHVGLLAIGYGIWGVCHFADDVAEFRWGEAVKTLTVGYNTNTSHLYSRRREKYTLFLWRKETHRAGFFSKEYYCIKLAYIQ